MVSLENRNQELVCQSKNKQGQKVQYQTESHITVNQPQSTAKMYYLLQNCQTAMNNRLCTKHGSCSSASTCMQASANA